jgi:endoglucanase
MVFTTNHFSVYVVAASTTILTGDLNGDGKVNGADAGILSRYTSGWKGYADKIKNMDAADINGDGKVNGADAGLLSRYTSGWSSVKKYFTV